MRREEGGGGVEPMKHCVGNALDRFLAFRGYDGIW